MSDDDLLAEARAIVLKLRLTPEARQGIVSPIWKNIFDFSPVFRNERTKHLTEEGSTVFQVLYAYYYEQAPFPTLEVLHEARTAVRRRTTVG